MTTYPFLNPPHIDWSILDSTEGAESVGCKDYSAEMVPQHMTWCRSQPWVKNQHHG